RMTDADAQAPEFRGPELRLDVSQAVVTRDAAAQLRLRLAGLEIELVVDDQDLRGQETEEALQRRNRAARRVHVRHGLGDAHVACARDVTREPRLVRA